MLNESRQNISTKESLLFCILGGLFVYFVCSIPLILFRLFPPTQSKGMDICLTTIYPPKYEAFIISFSIFTILGIYLSRKLNLKNRSVYFAILALIIAIGGGFLTGALETIYYVFIVSDNQEYFWATLDENYYGFQYSIEWTFAFTVIVIFFTPLYLITSSLITKFKNRNSLK